VQAVLFDIYGTLLLSERNDPGTDGKLDEVTRTRLRGFVKKYDIDMTPARLTAAVLEKITAVNRAATAAGRPYPEVNILHIWKDLLGRDDYDTLKLLALEFEMIVHQVRPAGDLAGLFSSLRARGLRLGIVSNAQFYTQPILEYFAGRPLPAVGFDKRLILYSYIYRIAKPSPRLFQKVTDRIVRAGLRPENVLFAGDNPANDIQPARQAGFKTVLFCGNESIIPQADDGRPDAAITDWNQIDRILS
jgi:putative hydrolase of the HAD superfamily